MHFAFRFLLIFACIALAPAVPAATFVVDSVLDDSFSEDANPGDGICDDSFPTATSCTLRAAIEEANALPGADRIEFSVAGEIGMDSAVLGALPEITDDLVIDAGTAPGHSFGGAPAVYLDGAAIDPGIEPFAAGLNVTAGALEVFALGIVAFPIAGIQFENGISGGRVDRCWIGLDAAGNPDTHPTSLSTSGVRLFGSNAVIGMSGPPGNVTGLGNVISGNVADGIQIFGDGNTILSNIIGMTSDGLQARGNGGSGIFMFDTADGNRIGGGAPGDDSGNHIADNNRAGIVVDGTGNTVDANTFGFRPGSGMFFNTFSNAIEVAGTGHEIGGIIGNRIIDHTGSGTAGILLGRTPPGGDVPASNVLVEGNEIGSDGSVGPEAGIRIQVAGSTSNIVRGNRVADASFGIEIAADGNEVTENRLGIDPTLGPPNSTGIRVRSSANDITFNEIGNSSSFGMVVDGEANTINFNDIGLAAGLGNVGNADSGIRLISGAVDNLIQGNRIQNNGGAGVELANSSPIVGNTIFGNSFRNNGGIGIDFLVFQQGVGSVGGPTPNDPGDFDEGANRRMNHPGFGNAVPLPGSNPVETVVSFVVDSDPAAHSYPITVDFYRADGYDQRQGGGLLGSATFDTFGSTATATLTLPAGVDLDDHFTATATDADGNTSEFAPARSFGEVIFRDGYEN